MIHGRRGFKKAMDLSEGKSNLAAEGLLFFKRIYKLEEFYRERNFTNEERYKAQKSDERPLLESYKK